MFARFPCVYILEQPLLASTSQEKLLYRVDTERLKIYDKELQMNGAHSRRTLFEVMRSAVAVCVFTARRFLRTSSSVIGANSKFDIS